MNTEETSSERRQHKRYEIADGIFSALPSFSLVAKIENISRSGIAFTCFSSDEQYFDRSKMEIFSTNNDCYLRELPFKIVSEIKLENHVPFSSLHKKQFCGEFIELTDNQKHQLDCFIKTFSTAKIDFKTLNNGLGSKDFIRIDKGGRRCWVDRRVFSYDIHLPERRSDLSRRTGAERRFESYGRSNKIEHRKKDH